MNISKSITRTQIGIIKVFNNCVNNQKSMSSINCVEMNSVSANCMDQNNVVVSTGVSNQQKTGETSIGHNVATIDIRNASNDTGHGQSISSIEESSTSVLPSPISKIIPSCEQHGKRKNEDIIVGNIKERLKFSEDSNQMSPCSVCNFSTSDHANLRRHNYLRSDEKPEKPFKRDICSSQFIKKTSYKIHMKKHGK